MKAKQGKFYFGKKMRYNMNEIARVIQEEIW